MHSRDAPDEPWLITVSELAEKLQLSERSIHGKRVSGELPAPIKLGRAVRWRADEIKAWLAAGAPPRDKWESMQQELRQDPACATMNGRGT